MQIPWKGKKGIWGGGGGIYRALEWVPRIFHDWFLWGMRGSGVQQGSWQSFDILSIM